MDFLPRYTCNIHANVRAFMGSADVRLILTTTKSYTAVVERYSDTGLFVGYVPGFPGAHSQAESLDELNRNLQEVIEMLLEDGEPKLNSEFVGTQMT